jgi:hypothetical protein
LASELPAITKGEKRKISYRLTNRTEASDELTAEDKGLMRGLTKNAAETENEARNRDE